MAILANLTENKKHFWPIILAAHVENRHNRLDSIGGKRMKKLTKTCLSIVACLSIAGGSTVAINSVSTIPTVTAASREKIDIANRDIASYLANCQQYESNDKQFQGFTSIKAISYQGKNRVKITVNDDFYNLSKPRRDLLIDTLQNGILGTLMDDQQEQLAESDIHKGIYTKVYLNNQLIGQSSKNNNRQINWQK